VIRKTLGTQKMNWRAYDPSQMFALGQLRVLPAGAEFRGPDRVVVVEGGAAMSAQTGQPIDLKEIERFGTYRELCRLRNDAIAKAQHEIAESYEIDHDEFEAAWKLRILPAFEDALAYHQASKKYEQQPA